MSKEIKLNLKVDSSSGEASIKRTSTQIKGLGTTAAAGGAAIGAGTKIATGGMLMMGAATTANVKILKKQYNAAAKVADQMKKTSKSMVQYAAAQTKANAAATKFGVALGGSSGKGGLIGSFMKYKTAILAVVAASAYFGYNMAKDSAAAEQQKKAFSNLATSHGADSDKIVADLKRMSGQTVDTATLIQKAGTAMMMGIDPTKLSDLMEIARATSKMTGQSVVKAFEDISLAVGRQSKMILDNLGIIVSVEKANKRYAKELGKTATQLTDVEKKQAFLNETLRIGKDLVNRLGDSAVSDVEKFEQFETAVKDLNKAFGNFLLPTALVLVTVLTDIAKALAAVSTAMGGPEVLTERIRLENLLAIAIKKRTEAEKQGQTEVVAKFNYIITNFENQIKNLDNIGAKAFKVTTDAPITERIRLENLLTEAIKRRAEAEKFGQTKYVKQFDNAIIILKEQLAALGEEEKPEVKKDVTDAEKAEIKELLAYKLQLIAENEKNIIRLKNSGLTETLKLLDAEQEAAENRYGKEALSVIQNYYDTLRQIAITSAGEDINKNILAMEQQTQQNIIEIRYSGHTQKLKLLENELNAFKGTNKEKLAMERLYNSEVGLLNKELVDEIVKNLKSMKEAGNISEEIEALLKPLEDIIDKDYEIVIDLSTTGLTPEQLQALQKLSNELKVDKDVGKKSASAFEDAWESALDNVENMFSDTFSSVLAGELDSFEDIFDSFAKNLQKTYADMMAKMVRDWIVGLAKQEAASKAADLTTDTDTTGNVVGGAQTGSSAGWVGAIVGMFLGYFMGKSAEQEAADQAHDAAILANTEASNSIYKSLEKNSKYLDLQLKATHSWTDAFYSATQTYEDAIEAIKNIPSISGKISITSPKSALSLENLAIVNYFKELGVIIEDINSSLRDFERAIQSLGQTSYALKISEIEIYYGDIALAIEDVGIANYDLLNQIKVAKAEIAEYQAIYDEATDVSVGPVDLYEIGIAGQNLDDAKEKLEDLEALLTTYEGLDLDWEESMSESLKLVEEFFQKSRDAVMDSVGIYTRTITGQMGKMEDALSSVNSKFENWNDTLEDLGASVSELLIIQENWLASIQAAADSAIFDPFESVLEDLLLLAAEVEGISKPDYYLDKYQAALSGNEWIAASEYLMEWYNAQDEATSAWESVTNSVESLVKSIDDVINSIKYSSLNVSLPTVIADLAEQDYATLKAAALTGDASEIEEFISFATTYLQKTQESLKSSAEYQKAYDQVMVDLVSFQDKLIAGDYDQKIYNELSNLNENLLQVGTDLESHLSNLRTAFESGFNPRDYAGFAKGGISSGPTSGYIAALHGREAVIPLDGGDIPVKITGAPTGQPLSINVYIGNEQLDTHITRQADMIRVKSNRRVNIPTQRLF